MQKIFPNIIKYGNILIDDSGALQKNILFDDTWWNAEYIEPRKGHWIDTDEWRETVDGFEQWGYFRKCSKCGYVFKFLEIDNYCPNCGADMREVEE